MAARRARTTKAGTRPAATYLDEPSQKRLADGLSRLEGHVRAVRRMVLERRCADEILLQLAACKAALSRLASRLVEHELRACATSCMDGNEDERLDRLARVLTTLLKQS
ncbi:MAG TPA: metal-sensing transcriptional repressor [Thermoanaerobaculia bacterium]|nr:metal-sensing transcriptional repressor [Thermoanaerobaculia bacterium]